MGIILRKARFVEFHHVEVLNSVSRPSPSQRLSKCHSVLNISPHVYLSGILTNPIPWLEPHQYESSHLCKSYVARCSAVNNRGKWNPGQRSAK